ncbi:aminopeptidase N-like [Macrobrachium rosenbergii]|uniref:aminopeptidase N-like n=1 Tax=Macrobrachium rosenbergii TaxID=79674 RepID=UPI0034D79AB4
MANGSMCNHHQLTSFVLLCVTTMIVSTVYSRKVNRSNNNEWTNVRLPTTLHPVHYVVKLQTFLNDSNSFQGYIEVELEVVKPTSRIILHLADLVVKNNTAKVSTLNKRRRSHPVRHEKYNSEREQYTLQLRRRLRQGKAYLLSMQFEGVLNEIPRGFYKTSYMDKDGVERKLAVTQFWPADARRAFPCFDEPALKATFDIHIARESHMTAVSNMPLIRTTPIPNRDGWVWDQFATTLNMSTYLVAFLISDYSFRDLEGQGKGRLRVWTSEDKLDQTSLALEVGSFAMSFFEDYFNLPYPLRKMDMAAVPETTFQAMENWGLITYRESMLLTDPKRSSASHRRQVSQLVAHELAHQWFGNLVTFKWWTDLWLNEGFATYMSDVAIDQMEPAWGILEQFVVTRLQSVMTMDSLKSSHPISKSLANPADIDQVFDQIPYSKGASVIRMMKHFLTESTFKKGLAAYLSSMSYKNADQDDLWRYMTVSAHQDGSLPKELTVKTIMDTWTLQEGYPVLTVVRDSNGTARVTQQRYLLGGDEQDLGYKWWIPVTFTSRNRRTFRHTRAQTWLSNHANHVTVTGLPHPREWVIFNLQMTGYYRVNYDDYNWSLLAYQLQQEHEVIHVTNRAQIIDDALNLARAGMLSYNFAMNMTRYLTEEKSYVVWKAAFSNMHFLYDMFKHTASYGALKDYFLMILEPVYDSLGFEDKPDDGLQTQLLRTAIIWWACRLGHTHCVNQSRVLFEQWMKDPDNYTVASNVAEAVYCSVINTGGQEMWEFAWDRFHLTRTAHQRKALGKALGCASDTWLLARYLEAGIHTESGLRRQDLSHVFEAVANSDVGSYVAWQFFEQRFKQIIKYVGSDFSSVSNIVEAVTKNFNTKQSLKQLQDLRAEIQKSRVSHKHALDQAIEVVENNVAWRKKNFYDLVRWLNQHGYSHVLTPS